MAEEIREVLNLLNERLGGLFPYRLELAAPGDLKLLEKNARYMKAEQFQALVENVKQDGNLSSLPLCYREKDGKLRVLSGNHRVMAARQAGVEQVLVMVVGDEKDADERMAIQLSHNAIAGQDDLVILKELWEAITDVQAKVYAGLDSDTVKALQGIQFSAISEQRLKYKMANFMFLPEEIESLDELLKETAVAFSADVVYLANLNTYDAFFDLVVKIKKKCVIKNSAAAFLKLLELARVGLEQMMKMEVIDHDHEQPQGVGHDQTA
jgi:hypothetical protein